MALQTSATSQLNQGLRIFFSEFVRVSLRHPSQALFFARTILWQARAARRRRAREARGRHHRSSHRHFQHHQQVQPAVQGLLRAGHPGRGARTSFPPRSCGASWRRRTQLGISFFVIAGGEPLTRPEIVDIARDFPHIVFLLVTNGLLLDASLIGRLAAPAQHRCRSLSIEGNQAETDGRRGAGRARAAARGRWRS